MRILAALALALIASQAFAQQIDQARQASAIPTLIEQRNNALDGLALCQGDLKTLQKKLADAESASKDKEKEAEKK